MIRLHRQSLADSWEIQRGRIIQETEQFLAHHLAHPEEVVRIPAVKASQANFKPWMTDWFWRKVLDF